jgi:hypothetical protein
MTTFKEFLLDEIIVEEISVDGDNLRITTQHYKAGSTKDAISTSFRSQPYTSKIKGTNAEIFSLLNYVSSDVSTNILKSLKGKGPYKVNEKQFSTLLQQVKQHAGIALKRIKPDVIIYPKSSSPLLKQFVDEIHDAYPHAEILEERFVKKLLDAEDVEPLINTGHPDWKKFSTEHPDQVELLKKNLKYQIKHGELELKKFYKPYLKFIKNFIELKDAYEVLEKVMGANVLVVDDILSSGTTMAEMIRQLEEFEPSKISGLTLFKLTSSAK